jgi:hypothetical protein
MVSTFEIKIPTIRKGRFFFCKKCQMKKNMAKRVPMSRLKVVNKNLPGNCILMKSAVIKRSAAKRIPIIVVIFFISLS